MDSHIGMFLQIIGIIFGSKNSTVYIGTKLVNHAFRYVISNVISYVLSNFRSLSLSRLAPALSVKPGRRETSTPSGAHPAGARGKFSTYAILCLSVSKFSQRDGIQAFLSSSPILIACPHHRKYASI